MLRPATTNGCAACAASRRSFDSALKRRPELRGLPWHPVRWSPAGLAHKRDAQATLSGPAHNCFLPNFLGWNVDPNVSQNVRCRYASGLILVLELDAGARFGPISQDAVDHKGKGRAAEPDLQRKRPPARLTPPAATVLNIACGQDMAPARHSNNEHGHCVRRYSEYPFVSDTSPNLRGACAACCASCVIRPSRRADCRSMRRQCCLRYR